MNAQRTAYVLTRSMLGTLTSLIGFGGLIGGIVLLIWQGTFSPIVIGTFAAGLLGMIAWWRLQPADFHAFISGRGVRHGTVTIFGTILLIGIVSMSYVLLARATLTWDMTLNQRFSLTDVSMSVIRRISRPMQITGFYTARALGNRESDDQYWRMYASASNGMIKVVYYDPEEVPALAQQFGVIGDVQVFISYLNPDGSVDFSLVSRVFLSGTEERDMTNAISRMLIAGTLTVYLDTSLGERDPLDSTGEGISGINNGMRESGLVTQPLDLATLATSGGDIPQNASAVIFARPLSDFTADQAAVVERYLSRGGSVLLITDVLFNNSPFLSQFGEFNNYLWQNYGIGALDAAVVDYGSAQSSPLEITGGALFQDQADLSANLSNNPTLFRLARALEVNQGLGNPDVTNGSLIMSSQNSYGETDLTTLGQTNTYHQDSGDLPGPLSLVAWAWNSHDDSRVILVGDSDFVSNGLILTAQGNAILLTNSMSWLTRLNEALTFGTQAYTNTVPIFYTAQQLDLIRLVTVFLIPGAVLIAGLAVWAKRARR